MAAVLFGFGHLRIGLLPEICTLSIQGRAACLPWKDIARDFDVEIHACIALPQVPRLRNLQFAYEAMKILIRDAPSIFILPTLSKETRGRIHPYTSLTRLRYGHQGNCLRPGYLRKVCYHNTPQSQKPCRASQV